MIMRWVDKILTYYDFSRSKRNECLDTTHSSVTISEFHFPEVLRVKISFLLLLLYKAVL